MLQRLSAFDWDDLKFFLAVARAGTIRGGADAIRANHATVSRRLAALERTVEARLFDRTKTGLKLTQLGEELLPHVVRIEEEIATASRAVVGRDKRPSGTIHVSIPPFMAMSSIMEDFAEFSRQFEDIDIHLDLTNAIASLERLEADVSIRYAYEVTDNVVGRRLVQCAKAAYCSPAYAQKMQDNGGEGLHWIGWVENEGDTTAPWVQKSPYPNATIRHRINEGAPQMALAAASAGLTVAACFVGDNYPGVVRAPYQKPELDRSIWLLLHNDLRKTARIRMFVDFLAERIISRKDEFIAGSTYSAKY